MKGIEYIYKVKETTKNPMAFVVDGTEKLIEFKKDTYIKTNLDHFRAETGEEAIIFEYNDNQCERNGIEQTYKGDTVTELYDMEGNFLGQVKYFDTFFLDGLEPCSRICQGDF